MKIRIKRHTIIAKQYISAMSKPVGGIIAEIGGDKVWEVINNMAKILLMPKHTAHNHWRTELASKIYKVSKLKSKNHLPTAEQIYDWSYDEVNHIQKLERILALCHNCHSVIHIGRTRPIRLCRSVRCCL